MTTDEAIAKLEGVAEEMQQLYYANERWADENFNAEYLGLDNVTGNICTYELWHFLQVDDKKEVKEYIGWISEYMSAIKNTAENKGYGVGAASRGFDVTKPAGRYWTLACKGLRYCGELNDLINNLNK